jgi:hypothetical protein
MPRRVVAQEGVNSQPISAADAIRPLSVGIFLAVFVPAATLAGAALVNLLLQTTKLEEKVSSIDQTVSRTASDVATLKTQGIEAAVDIKSLKGRLAIDAPAPSTFDGTRGVQSSSYRQRH